MLRIIYAIVITCVIIFVAFPIWGPALGGIIGFYQKTREKGNSVAISILKTILMILAFLIVLAILSMMSNEEDWIRWKYF